MTSLNFLLYSRHESMMNFPKPSLIALKKIVSVTSMGKRFRTKATSPPPMMERGKKPPSL